MPTGFASWMSCAERKQWHFADLWSQIRGFYEAAEASTSGRRALVNNAKQRQDGSRRGAVSCGALTCDSPNLLSSGVLRVLEHRVKLIRTPIEHTNCLKRHNCKKSGSEHEFGSKLQPSCLHLGRRGALHRRLAKAQLRWTRQRQQTTDATERNMKTRTARASRRRIAASQSCQRSAHAG